ncbi:D-aspartate oxidase-like isoform X2 [Gigantopelta aegis]|nr:D-aspartate oxidase-like isoform X2 [Gigantopelta aegis]XP_041375731.1 D-aspartate oxidase-like isoform X2 [Gigantopelta aegis]XP_041375732.1 D-aspartate oxidase-like isoform X2 [Gigantopelta aegis]XP_041375733.1 D-aspartate oxidase-like isoform X2 [Gigantopelta aegis]
MVKICVIGAGIVGLSSATITQDRFPEATVKIIADRFGNDTTSWGAGGLFRPSLKHITGTSPQTVRKWCHASWDRYIGLAQSSLAKETGISLVTGFVASRENEDFMFKEITINAHDLSKTELKRLQLPYNFGVSCTTVITEVTKYMPWLMKRFQERGGTLEQRTIKNLNELAGEFDIVINCCGFAALDLVGDKKVYPIRGQLVKVKAPWIKHWYLTSDNTYLIPHCDCVIIGGCRQKNNFSTSVDPEMSADIMMRAKKLFPQLEGAEVIGEWAGLRPCRSPPRIEKEFLFSQGRKLRIVHNYGHGANGITLSWGTSLDAVDLVEECMNDLRTSKL